MAAGRLSAPLRPQSLLPFAVSAGGEAGSHRKDLSVSAERHLVVYVKAPLRGQVKSRLARGIGWGEATRFYRLQTMALLRRLGRDRRWRLWLAVAPDRAVGGGYWPAGLPRLKQGRGDLGRRMPATFRRFRAGAVLIVGSDIPDISPARIDEAFRRLAAADIVFGPAPDGGYWLVGSRGRTLQQVQFAGVRWSSPTTLADSLASLGRFRVAFATKLADIDDRAGLDAWRRTKSGRLLKVS
ncbi:MAG: DUF2064 domain-containing protein [Alphaproteobacteria bacterium]|nr:DUF2064 domain-containing protein [Alphaproteobacteria bacterium]